MRTEVRVYCDEPSHEPKVVQVETYQRIESGKWRAVDNAGSAMRNWRHRHDDGPSSKHVGAKVQQLDAFDPEEGQKVKWTRHRLECRLCSLTVPVRAERLRPVLDKLLDAEVEDISLRALGAILR